MARVKVAITKSAKFHGKQEEFSNVYTLDGVDTGSDSDLNAIADRMVEIERPIFSVNVSFLKVQIWSVGALTNYMYLSKALTVKGLATHTAGMYTETAVLVSWPLPRAYGLRRTIRRDLRKYLHTCHSFNYNVAGQDDVPASARAHTPLNTYMDACVEPRPGTKLCAENGDLPTGQGISAPYLQHRQFPRGRKETA